MHRLDGKKALVIGGSTGIGREVCRLFAHEGADVAVADLGNADGRISLVDEIRALGRVTIEIEVDVVDEAQVKAAIDAAIGRFEHLDILVNNAGVGGDRGPLHEQTVEEYERILNVNLRGVFFGMKHVTPHMLERGYGRIINTASQTAHRPPPFKGIYAASKAGVVALTVSMAQEVATRGITVNVVAPGPTNTAMWNRPDNADWRDVKVEQLPMKRVADPLEIAWAYVYLASDESSYLTGQTISPNGGDVMW